MDQSQIINSLIFGLDIETLGAGGPFYSERTPLRHRVFSIALSVEDQTDPAFIGRVRSPRLLDPRRLSRLHDKVRRAVYYETHVPREISRTETYQQKYIRPSIQEVRKHRGSRGVYKSEKRLIHSFYDRLKQIQQAAETQGQKPVLVGHNIKQFDIPNILAAAEAHDSNLRIKLEGLIKGDRASFRIVDTLEESKRQLKAIYAARGQKFQRGATLDVIAEALDVQGRVDLGKHGGLEDARVAVNIMKALKEKKLTFDNHLKAMLRSKNLRFVKTAQAIRASREYVEATTIYKGPIVPIDDMGNLAVPAEKPATKVGNKFIRGINKVRGLFAKNTKAKLGWTAAAVGGAYLLFSDSQNAKNIKDSASTLFDSIAHPFARRADYISSSSLGLVTDSHLIGRAFDPGLGDEMMDLNPDEATKLRRTTKAGNYIHTMIQRELMEVGLATETESYVEDAHNKVFGYIDVILNSGVPMEIKTVSDIKFGGLKEPSPSHISQANFYALSRGVNVAKVMYVSREAPSKRKIFTIAADPGLYLRDIERVRGVQARTRMAHSRDPYLKGFRPINSWFGGGINYNMPHNRKSGVQSQRGRLSSLPVSQHMAQQPHTNHPNQSRQGVM